MGTRHCITSKVKGLFNTLNINETNNENKTCTRICKNNHRHHHKVSDVALFHYTCGSIYPFLRSIFLVCFPLPLATQSTYKAANRFLPHLVQPQSTYKAASRFVPRFVQPIYVQGSKQIHASLCLASVYVQGSSRFVPPLSGPLFLDIQTSRYATTGIALGVIATCKTLYYKVEAQRRGYNQKQK